MPSQTRNSPHTRSRSLVSVKVAAGIVAVLLFAAAALAFMTLRPGAGGTSATQGGTSPYESGVPKGVTFSPATYDSTGITDFFAKAPQAGSIVEWAGDWQQLGGGGGPALVAEQASQHNLKAMIVAQFFTQSTGALLRPLDPADEQDYLNITARFVKQYKPAYLGVGIEVNVLYEKNATNFGKFVSFYPEVYDEVKSLSPQTMVFTIFQLEKMNGLNGGLYGGSNDPNKAEWKLLELFPKSDIVAFTTYPSLIYQNPSDIPSDYYSSIASHTNKSVGFTEVGWHTGYIAGGWGSNESEQAGFVATFFGLSKSLDRAFAVWSFMYDQNTVVPFNTMGLHYVNGTAKLSWETWASAQ